MPDRPDWSKYLIGSERHSLQDMGELAVRLGSPVTYDRRGEVIWYDIFAHGLTPWNPVIVGGGCSVSLDVDYAPFSGYCVKLYTAGVENDRAVMYRYFAAPEVNKWGIEVAVALFDAYKEFRFQLQRYDGTYRYTARIRLNETASEIQLVTTNAATVKIDDLVDLTYENGVYHLMKLVADMSTNEYERFIFNQTEYNISGNSLYITEEEHVPLSEVIISNETDANEGATMRIGRVIVTANEP